MQMKHGATPPKLMIDSDFPGGNVLVDAIAGDVVELRPDLRDTEGWWFYWCFRVTGAHGRRLTFRFTHEKQTGHSGPMTVRGPAASLDRGSTWRWLGLGPEEFYGFDYDFPPACGEVRFAFTMAYTQEHLDSYLRQEKAKPVRREVLCQSPRGRKVERLHLGKAGRTTGPAILVSARQHACETMGSYALEGILDAALAHDELGNWFREEAELMLLPFGDKDGVEDGDQGKNRIPRDHNRDYDDHSLHPEPLAMRAFVPQWLNGRQLLMIDIHCPWIRGPMNETIYQVGNPDPAIWRRQARFGEVLERVQRGPLLYRAADNLPFGKAWNTAEGRKKGRSISWWAATLPGMALATSVELPYANALDREVNQASARELGRDIARAFKDYLAELEG